MSSTQQQQQHIESAPPEAGADSSYKWRVLVSVLFGLFMVILDTTVVNVAFQTLRQEFSSSLSSAQWIISIYVLALGIATPTSGFLADRFGIKRTYVTGLFLFVLGSVLCGVAPSLITLVLARVLQGIGGGIALPLGTASILRAFPPAQHGMALGIFGMVMVLAPAIGPVLGGYFVSVGLWRAIFFINLPIGLLGIALATRFLREVRSDVKPRWDKAGLLFSAIGFGCVLCGASRAATAGWTENLVLLAFAVGILGLIAFTYVELRVAEHPLLDLRLFERSTFSLAATQSYIGVMALFGAEFLMPLYLQTLRQQDAFTTGMILLPLAIAAGVTTPNAGRLYDKVGPRLVTLIGFGALALNTWQFAGLTVDTPVRTILWLLALRGFALGMIVQTTQVTALSVVPRSDLPRGSSLLNSTRQVVQAIGVALLATIVSGSAGSIQGFERAYLFTFYLSLLAVAVGLLLPGWPGPWTGRKVAR